MTADHLDAVRSDYERKVDRWRAIYEGATFHDHVIQRRLQRALEAVDKLGGAAGAGAAPRALDVGCGAGQLALALAERGYEVSAVDVAEGMVAATRQRFAQAGRSADVRVADVQALPYDDATFTWVTALGLVEYLPDPAVAVREFARVARPGGHVLFTAPNPLRIAFWIDPVGVLLGLLGPPEAGYRRRYLHRWRLERMAREAGLEVVGLLGHGVGPLQVAKRPVLPPQASIAISTWAERRLPLSWLAVLGANLILVARKPEARP